MILIRGEFYLLFVICTLFLFEKKKIKQLFIAITISVLIISPYLVRNYFHFNEIIITKSSGYNLWRGNNAYADVNGNFMDDSYYKNLDKDKRDILLMLENKKKISNYEIEIDNYLKNRAIKNIISKPFKYLHLYFKKLLYFLFVNIESTYPNYFSLLVIVPELVYSIFAVLGLYLNLISKKKNYNFASIFIFYKL